jgi:polyisoprenyl-teichoic acid--peptidoglycan teichoic acid transferase
MSMKYVNITKQFPPPSKHEKSRSKVGPIILGLFLTGVAILFLFRNEVRALFNPVSIVSTIARAKIKETDGRTNVLVLGSDKRAHENDRNVLTDTLLLISIGRVEGDIVMISLPRDLWVKSPGGAYSKINAVYARGGGEEISQTAELVLGVPVHYYAVIDFELFKDSIDTLGGVEVYVDNSFVDTQYPVEGKENAPSINERYQTISFQEGWQTMDGETALKFVRSRKGNNTEGTDFARSARQQKVIMAIKEKATKIDTLMNPVKLADLYSAYSNNVDTNMTLTDIQNFYLLSQQVDFENLVSVVLDDRSAAGEGGLLYSPEDTSLLAGAEGAYVLLPKAGDFYQIHAYVQRYIFGAKR